LTLDEFETLSEQYAQASVAQQADPNFLATQAEAKADLPSG